MGVAQSIPSGVEGVHFATTQPPRNKLTKPRTNSNTTREPSCLPSLPPSISRLSPLRNSRSSPAGQYQIAEDQSQGSIFAIEYANTIQSNAVRNPGKWEHAGDGESESPVHLDQQCLDSMLGVDSVLCGVASPTFVSSGVLRKGSMVTRSPTNSSAACAPPPGRNSEVPSVGTVRRRSQLLAAPPATATRKPTKSHKQTQNPPITLLSPDPFAIESPLGSDPARCTTPSGYSVLGAFKRGSLRIANGAASPAPSSPKASPELSTRAGYFGSDLELPGVAKDRPISWDNQLIVLSDSVDLTPRVRLVPSPPADWREENESRVSRGSFSFARGSSIYDEDIPDSSLELSLLADDPPGSLQLPINEPTNLCESLFSAVSSPTSTGFGYKILTEQCLNKGLACLDVGMAAPVGCTGIDEYHKFLSKEAPKVEDQRLRRPSINKIGSEGTDSGYSSSGSVNSWTTAWSEQRTSSGLVARGQGDPGVTSGTTPAIASVEKAARTVAEASVAPREGVIAAIRRRYSQGDLKAFARSNEGTKQPPIPRVPAIERRRTLTKPRPELKHRRSMVVVTKGPALELKLPETSPRILPVPPLPRPSRLERKGSFNHLTVEDYLPLVEDFPLMPIIDHATDTVGVFSTGTGRNTQDSIVNIDVGRVLNRGSKITGQDYYQRFSRRPYEEREPVVS